MRDAARLVARSTSRQARKARARVDGACPHPAAAAVIAPKKSLGQNFLRDPNTVRRIAGALEPATGGGVVEIGPGLGALTADLLARFPKMAALEVDQRAIEHLRATLPALDVRHTDVLEADWNALAADLGAPLSVIGNLPYYITSPILFALLDARAVVGEVVVMMQREVAERLVAAPRTKAYGILSVAVQRYADVRLLFRVPPTVFHPRPNVESAVVRLVMRADAPPVSRHDAHVRAVLRMAFNQRRKMLRGALAAYGPVPEPWATQRAEELTPADFDALATALAR